MTYGNWTILKELDKSQVGKRTVLARCKCGTEKAVQLGNLRSGKSTQCSSCAKRGRPGNRRIHGEARKTVEWMTWRAVHHRCTDVNGKSYKHYGGRGIVVSDRWHGENGYSNFLADMGRRPGPGYSIERRYNDGPYSSSNCYWATTKEQGRNKRTNLMVTIEGRTMCLASWADESEFSYITIWKRLKRGWASKDAVFGRKRLET